MKSRSWPAEPFVIHSNNQSTNTIDSGPNRTRYTIHEKRETRNEKRETRKKKKRRRNPYCGENTHCGKCGELGHGHIQLNKPLGKRLWRPPLPRCSKVLRCHGRHLTCNCFQKGPDTFTLVDSKINQQLASEAHPPNVVLREGKEGGGGWLRLKTRERRILEADPGGGHVRIGMLVAPCFMERDLALRSRRSL